MPFSNATQTSIPSARRARRAQAAASRKATGKTAGKAGKTAAKAPPAPAPLPRSDQALDALRPRFARLRSDEIRTLPVPGAQAGRAGLALVELASRAVFAEALAELDGTALWSAEHVRELHTSASALIWLDAILQGQEVRRPTVPTELVETLKAIVDRMRRLAGHYLPDDPAVTAALAGVGSSQGYAALASDALRLHAALSPRQDEFDFDRKYYRKEDFSDAPVLADRVQQALAVTSPEVQASLRHDQARAWTVFRRDFRRVRLTLAALIPALGVELELPSLRPEPRRGHKKAKAEAEKKAAEEAKAAQAKAAQAKAEGQAAPETAPTSGVEPGAPAASTASTAPSPASAPPGPGPAPTDRAPSDARPRRSPTPSAPPATD